MLKYIILLSATVLLLSCSNQNTSDARSIVEKAVKVHGGDRYKDFDIGFDFRKFKVKLSQHKDTYVYERATKDSLGNEVRDILTNGGFERKINDITQKLSEKDTDRFREATNSIAYFALLPSKLLDPAVRLEHLGTSNIGGQTYDKIKVSFAEEGGGQDHTDVFCYWFNQQTHTLDYLSYDNGGPRFRKATKRQTVAGIIFQDYENYEIADTTLPTSAYDKVFEAGQAKLLSKIEQLNYISNPVSN